MSERIVVIGLDGADWRVLRPLIADGTMPNLGHLVEQGVSGYLESSIPTQSNTAWTTFMTGVNPGKHGVYSFQERSPNNPTQLVGVNSRSIRSETLFHSLSRQDRTVGAVNVPVTYPPFPVNGYLVSGMFVPQGATFTYPQNLAQELDQATCGFPVNRIRWRFMPGQFEGLLDEAIDVHQQRTRVLLHLLDEKPTDVFIQVFISPDRVQHALMHLIDPSHPRHCADEASLLQDKIRRYFGALDEMLGEVIKRVDQHQMTLIVLSDHGFRPCDRQLVVSEILASNGLLKYDRRRQISRSARRFVRRFWAKGSKPANSAKKGQSIGRDLDWSQTRAYVATSTEQGVSINLAGREPNGIVQQNGEYERTRDEVRMALASCKDPTTGRPVIENVWRREELYQGPFVDMAPDLVFTVAPGLSVGNERKQNLAPLKWRTGEHDQLGIFVGYGTGISQKSTIEGARLVDLAPTILYLSGAAIPEDMDGKVLTDAFDPQVLANRAISYEAGAGSFVPETQSYSEEEEAEIAEQLRALGYL